MSRVTAIYRGGIFQPLEPVALAEEQRVQLSFEAEAGDGSLLSWLRQLQDLQSAVILRAGLLPDSTADIAMDRLR